jgi:hydroxymethylbilane synthase
MTTRPLILGTRGSPLAIIQTNMAVSALRAVHPIDGDRAVVQVYGSAGDTQRDRPIEAVGGRGAFTDELDDALLSGAIGTAVHSAKDLPVPLDRRLVIAAMLPREDPREAFVSVRFATLADLPLGASFGTASVRREALVRRLRPDLEFVLLRGNVGDRVATIESGAIDATILAVAGLKRLGLARAIAEPIAPSWLMPDPGQGAIAIVCRANDAETQLRLAAIDHRPTSWAVAAERAFLAATGADAAGGALAEVDGDRLTLSATLVAGSSLVAQGEESGRAAEAAAIGHRLGRRLLASIADGRAGGRRPA